MTTTEQSFHLGAFGRQGQFEAPSKQAVFKQPPPRVKMWILSKAIWSRASHDFQNHHHAVRPVTTAFASCLLCSSRCLLCLELHAIVGARVSLMSVPCELCAWWLQTHCGPLSRRRACRVEVHMALCDAVAKLQSLPLCSKSIRQRTSPSCNDVQLRQAHKTITWDDRLLSICEQRGKARLAMLLGLC